MKVSAIIIARGGSTRLPGKNLMEFQGRPLVAHKVCQLHRCSRVDDVFVGSDSDDILVAASKAGAQIVRRDAEFCDEITRSWNEVIVDMCQKASGDIVVWAHCTNPLIRPETYDEAVSVFLRREKAGEADSLVSVTRLQSHLWFQGHPFNFNPRAQRHPVAKELEPIFYQNGGIFIARRQDMIRWSYVYGDKPHLFEIDEIQSIDIDTKADFEAAVRAAA